MSRRSSPRTRAAEHVTPNGNAPVKSSAEIEIDAPPQVVWEVLTRFENWRTGTRT